jgi:uncharacterized protein (DUF427 family)
MSKPVRVPGPNHPIDIEPSQAHVMVRVAGKVIVNTRSALIWREASYPPVLYLPRSDADLSLLQRTDHATYCPYKGDCSYYSIPLGGAKSLNAVWTYEEPYTAVEAIRGYLAFYRDRIDSMEMTGS